MIDLEADLLPDIAPSFSVRCISGERMDRDMDKVADYCAQEIRRASRQFIDSTYGTNTASTIDPNKPLNAAELHRAAVTLQLKMLEVMQDPEQELEDWIEAREMERENEVEKWLRQNPLPDDAVYASAEENGLKQDTIFFREEQSKRTRKRSYKHEMAHHIQRHRVASALYDAETVVCNERNGFRVRHEISKRVEGKV